MQKLPWIFLLSVFALWPIAATATAPDMRALAGHWEGAATLDGKSFRLALDYDPDQPASALVDYPELPLYGMRFKAAAEADGLKVERHPATGPMTKFTGTVAEGKFTGLFNGAGAKDARFELERKAAAHILREEAVQFSNGSVSLAGTIIFPAGPPPYPAIVLTHGSDPDTRESASYHSRGVLFAQHGVAALIYDKRGTGESTGDFITAGIDDLAKDAVAGVDLLKNRMDIDRTRIGVFGFSQGGWIAPLAATLSENVAFVHVQSAASVSPSKQSLYHNANEMRAAGASETDIRRAEELRSRLYAQLRQSTSYLDKILNADLEAASKQSWFAASKLPMSMPTSVSAGERHLLLFEPLPVWREVHVPVLAIWGEHDINLPAADSRDEITHALAVGGNKDVETHILPALTHSLLREKKSGDAWDFPRGGAELEPLIENWLGRKVIRHAS
jgi:dipeptidyl aminopeptidase/acylaminoacyl peptidase